MRERGPTRRALLGGSVLLTASCSPFGTTGSRRREDERDLAIVRRAIDAEQSILGRYDDARRLHPSMAVRLDAIAAHHREHLAALRRRLGGAPPNASPTPRPDGAPAAGPVPAPMPDSPELAVAVLAADEEAAARARVDDIGAASAALAQLLASVSASEASHAALLTETA